MLPDVSGTSRPGRPFEPANMIFLKNMHGNDDLIQKMGQEHFHKLDLHKVMLQPLCCAVELVPCLLVGRCALLLCVCV